MKPGLLFLTLVVGGCGTPADTSRTLSVEEVASKIHSLDGERVRIAGYLANCGGYDCSLFANKEEAGRFWQVARTGDRKVELPTFLTIGHEESFDQKAGPLAGQNVLVTAVVTSECTGPDGKPLCLDRGPDLNPIDIEPITKRPEKVDGQ